MEYGLIGAKLGHSYSKEIHESFADYSYELLEIPEEKLPAFLTERAFKAINVTIPYKQTVIPFLDEVSEQALTIGAVNTIVNRNGKLYGYNTDLEGLKALIQRNHLDLNGKKVLIFGAGGTSKTAAYAARELGAACVIKAVRNKKQGLVPEDADALVTFEEACRLHADAQVILNTTPAGMFPDAEGKACEISGFSRLEGLIDVVYNPLRTNLVLDAAERGIASEGGLYMLAAQAVFACGLFLDRSMQTEDIERAFQQVLLQKRNLVLCGMPSCGKTTAAAELQNCLHRDVIDTDDLVVAKAGMAIAEYSAKNGEKAFRDLESEAVRKVSLKSGVIIATGGGAVLREENVRALKRNGILVFIDRPLEQLTPTADRPFSRDVEAMKKRYEERYEIYCGCADVRVDGSGSIREVRDRILKATGVIE